MTHPSTSLADIARLDAILDGCTCQPVFTCDDDGVGILWHTETCQIRPDACEQDDET